MRYPGDTNRMALKFQREVYACIKECDPQAIMLGEGASLEAPVNVFSIHANPHRTEKGMGPRDFLLYLNQFSPKRLVIDQGPRLAPGNGYCVMAEGERWQKLNQYMTRLLAEKGGRNAFASLPNDLSIIEDLLVVPVDHPQEPTRRQVELPAPWSKTTRLIDVLDSLEIKATRPGIFADVSPGVYRMR
jgi:hypothetical protein